MDKGTSTRMSHNAFKMTTRTPGSSDLYTSISALSREHNMRLGRHIKWTLDIARLTVYLPM